jgi:uncharacterized protein
MIDATNIRREFKEDEGVFFIETEGERLAKMFIRLVGTDRFIIEHTEVSPKLKGQGIGNQFVNYAVDYARKNHLKIVPLCPFAKKVLQGSNEYKDVL